MKSKVKYRRGGANPPKKVSGMTGAGSSSHRSTRSVKAGNGTCIAAKILSHSKPPAIVMCLAWLQALGRAKPGRSHGLAKALAGPEFLESQSHRPRLRLYYKSWENFCDAKVEC